MVGKAFWGLGLSAKTNLYGYYYAKEAVVFIIRNECLSGKRMMIHIAEKFDTGAKNIERCIRTMIETSWNSLKVTSLFEEKPTCRGFILKMAEYVNLGICEQECYYNEFVK